MAQNCLQPRITQKSKTSNSNFELFSEIMLPLLKETTQNSESLYRNKADLVPAFKSFFFFGINKLIGIVLYCIVLYCIAQF